jgi:hypothetical protein
VFDDVSESVASLVGTMENERVEALLIQYVPFLYARRGLSKLPQQVAVNCQALGINVTTFVHEPWVPPTRLPWMILSPLHRRQLRRIIAASDSTVTAVPTWARKLGPSTKTVYVGCTLGDPPADLEHEPALTAPVVFSPFASGLRWDWITRAVHAIGTGLIVVGSDRATADRHSVVGQFVRGGWDFRGRLSAEETLRLLARASLVLAPFVDGMTGRRTSAMAALSVGSRLLTSKGHLFDPAFAVGPAYVAGPSDEFVRLAVDLWHANDTAPARDNRLAWSREYLSAARLDSDLLRIVKGRSRL